MKIFFLLSFFVMGFAQAKTLIVNCHSPLFEGELRVYQRASGNYAVSLSGIKDFPTKKVSAGPGGLFLQYIENGKVNELFVEPFTGKSEVEAEVSPLANPKDVQKFSCNYVL